MLSPHYHTNTNTTTNLTKLPNPGGTGLDLGIHEDCIYVTSDRIPPFSFILQLHSSFASTENTTPDAGYRSFRRISTLALQLFLTGPPQVDGHHI